MALGQTIGFVESLLKLIGLDRAVPDFGTLSRRQKTLAVTIPYRGSIAPVHLRIDSTGLEVEAEGAWTARKHGGPKRRVWRKNHLGIDGKTLQIRAVAFTRSGIGEAPMLPELRDQISPEQEIGSVTAEGAYDTRKGHDAMADRGAAAVIPPRKTARPCKPNTAGAVARNEALRASKYLGNISVGRSGETGVEIIAEAASKRRGIRVKLPGQRLMAPDLDAPDFGRQGAELRIRIAVLNRCTALRQTCH